MYKLFLDLAEFLAACKQVGAILNVQPVQKGAQHTIPYVEAGLMLTAAAPTRSPGAPRILAARVVVEETQMWPDDGAARTALTERAALADTLLRATCIAARVAVAPHDGILAEPGLLTDLWQISTAQELWHIERPDMRDSTAWTVQPRPLTGPPVQAAPGD